MTKYLYRNILIHGSGPCRNEKLAASVILLALYVSPGRELVPLAAEYRLPEDYIAGVLTAELPPEGEENETGESQ